MRISDRDVTIQGAIIPFEPRKPEESDVQTSTIAALIAVTILHGADERPEEKLIDLIEQSGDAEVIDTMDAADSLLEDGTEAPAPTKASNDNVAQ